MSGIGGIDFALLKFCLQHNDSPNISDTQLTRDPADYEWLRRVMDSLPSVQKQMEQCVDIIHNDEDENNKIDALEILQDLVEDIDNANDLARKGLGEIAHAMTYHLGDKDNEKASKIRALSCWILSTLSQNNPIGQKAIIDQGILPIVSIVLKDNVDNVSYKALGIVSSVARGNNSGLHYFEQHKDSLLDILKRLLEESSSKLITKTCVVLRHLCKSDDIRQVVVKEEISNQLVNLMSNSSDNLVREMAIRALIKVVPSITNQDSLKEIVSLRLNTLSDSNSDLVDEIEVLRSLLSELENPSNQEEIQQEPSENTPTPLLLSY